MSERDNSADDDMLPEYDFTKAVRGKYAAQFKAGSNVVVLDEDVAKIFPDSESANRALRALAKIIRESTDTASGMGE